MLKKCIAVLLAVILLFGALSIGVSAKAEAKEVVLSESAASHTINPNMYGIFIEDINNAVEGGLNATLVRNNSFEYLRNEQELSGWEFSGGYTRETEGGMNANNPSFITISGSDKLTVKNLGFCEYYDYKTYDVNEKSMQSPGMGISAGETYEFSVWLKNTHTTAPPPWTLSRCIPAQATGTNPPLGNTQRSGRICMTRFITCTRRLCASPAAASRKGTASKTITTGKTPSGRWKKESKPITFGKTMSLITTTAFPSVITNISSFVRI